MHERAAGETPVPVPCESGDVRLELDRVHRLRSAPKRLEHQRTTARPEHEHPRAFEEVVGKGGRKVVEIGGRRFFPPFARNRNRPVAVDEEGHLLGDRSAGEEAESRRPPERHLLVLDRAHAPERARPGLGELRTAHPEGLRERLERRDPKLVPVPLAGDQQEEDAGRGTEEGPPGPPPGPDRGDRSRERRNHAEAVQSPFRGQHGEEGHRENRSAPGAREVRRVDPREAVPEHDEGAADPGRGDEEGNGEEDLDDEQPAERPERPGQLQYVEGDVLGDCEADGGGDREREGGEGEEGSGGDPEPMADHHQEGAARPESEEGGADH